MISARLGDRLGMTLPLAFLMLAARLFQPSIRRPPGEVADVHYDLPIDIHEATYDKRLTASCAYWNGAESLDQAQENKLELICRKVGLRARPYRL